MTALYDDMDLAVINYVASDDLDKLISFLGSHKHWVYKLDGKEISEKQSLLVQLSAALFGHQVVANWSSFEDLLYTWVNETSYPHLAIVWTDAHRMLEGGLGDLVTALDIMTRVARHYYEQEIDLVIFLIGDGPNFAPLDILLNRE